MSAYTYTFTSTDSNSTILRSDGYEFPRDPSNGAYIDWLTFTSNGGSTTAATPESLDALHARFLGRVASLAGDRRTALVADPDQLLQALRYKEAQDYDAAIAPSDGDYPLLGAQVGTHGASVLLVHSFYLTQLATLKTNLAFVDSAVNTANAAINAATTAVACQAIVDALDLTA
jgi:hypothetical protein